MNQKKSKKLSLKRVLPPECPLLTLVDEEKAEANKKRFAALEMLKEIEEEFAKLRDRYQRLRILLTIVFLQNVPRK